MDTCELIHSKKNKNHKISVFFFTFYSGQIRVIKNTFKEFFELV